MCKSLYPTRTFPSNHPIVDLVRDAFPDVLATSYSPDVGRMNHDCQPNVSVDFQWSADSDDESTAPPGIVCVVSRVMYYCVVLRTIWDVYWS